MKTIGLLGGTGWSSTIGYYTLLNEKVGQRLGGYHSAKIILSSVDYHDIMSNYGKDNSATAVKYLFVFMIAMAGVNEMSAMRTVPSTKFITTLETIGKIDELEKTAITQEYLIELRQLVDKYQQFCVPEKEHLTDFKEYPNLALLLAAELGNYEVIPDL